MNSRKLANQRQRKIRKFFRPIAMAAMLAVASIMPMKKADAAKERKTKVMKVQKPKWAKEKKKKDINGPNISLTLFGGVYDKLKTSFIGAGINANQSFGPVNVNALFEIASNGVEKLVVENASVTTTLPLRRPEQNKKLPITLSLYTYRGRICGTNVGFGGSLNVGFSSIGMEYDFPGPAAPLYVQRSIGLFEGKLNFLPGVIYVTNMELLGGYFNTSYAISNKLKAQSQIWFMTNPAASELLALNWRLGVSANF
jgi:hypothetical protein